MEILAKRLESGECLGEEFRPELRETYRDRQGKVERVVHAMIVNEGEETEKQEKEETGESGGSRA